MTSGGEATGGICTHFASLMLSQGRIWNFETGKQTGSPGGFNARIILRSGTFDGHDHYISGM
eukprot:744028-Hanusia_phi.AAC.1